MRKRLRRGMSLIEALIAIAIVMILAVAMTQFLGKPTTKAQTTAILRFINDLQGGIAQLKTSPECSTMPADAVQLRNALSDSLCRTDATDNRGYMRLPERIAGKFPWTWRWDNATQTGTLTINNVPQDVATLLLASQEVAQMCQYANGSLTCTVR